MERGLLLIKTDGPNNAFRNNVGVSVGGRSSVLQVAASLLCHAPGDADGGAPVGHAGGEVVNGGGLMKSSEATLVVLASMGIIGANMSIVVLSHLINRDFNLKNTILFSHGLRREVGMHTRAIPVSRDWLAVQ